LTHVHLNDNDGTCDLHLPPGQGTIPFVSVFRALVKVGFSGAVVAEITYHGTDDLEQAARAFRGYEAEAG
jgi:sugar phosphate isomerase/epimerase